MFFYKYLSKKCIKIFIFYFSLKKLIQNSLWVHLYVKKNSTRKSLIFYEHFNFKYLQHNSIKIIIFPQTIFDLKNNNYRYLKFSLYVYTIIFIIRYNF